MKYTIQTHNENFDANDKKVAQLWLDIFKSRGYLQDCEPERVHVYEDLSSSKNNPYFFGFPIIEIVDYFRIKKTLAGDSIMSTLVELIEDPISETFMLRVNDENATSNGWLIKQR